MSIRPALFFGAISNGVYSIDGAISDLVKVNAGDNTKIDVLGGTGIITDNSNLGLPHTTFVTWTTTVGISIGVTDGLFNVVVDENGVISIVDSGGGAKITINQFNNFIQLGGFTAAGGVVVVVGAAFWPIFTLPHNAYALGIGLGVFNFPGQQGYDLTGITGGLTMTMVAGTIYSTIAGVETDVETPSVVVRTVDISPVSIVGLIDPVTGSFSFSATSELDPTQVSKRDSITAFSDAGGGDVTVTSNQHGITTGNIVTIANTTNYNGTFTIVSNTGNTFDITTTFVADDATGSWSALTATANNRFTAQRLYFFPSSVVIGAYYGLVEYQTISDFDTAGGELSEGFVEPDVTAGAAKIKLIIIDSSMVDFSETTKFDFRAVVSRFK